MSATIGILPNPVVALSPLCRTFAIQVAEQRFADVVRHARQSRAKEVPGDSARMNHIVGAIGEHAFSTWLHQQLGKVVDKRGTRFGVCPCELYKGTVNTFSSEGDVGSYQVRTRTYAVAPLIVRERDKDEDIFVLVIPNEEERASAVARDLPLSVVPRWTVVGWKRAADAKVRIWRNDPRDRGAAYFVPQRDLEPLFTLPIDESKGGAENAR